MENNSRFVQLEIPGMEQFFVTTQMTLQSITDISAKSQDNQITFHQLEIPGMEELLSKLKTQSEPSNSTDYSGMIEDCAA
ncbi:MAG: hypothetical protein RMX96_21995 [Nostoc sp. ChiSLP02]|nr:hypothetical protein [Nostoc sp. DedSLP05]MDZ8097312.1 hypothetical protein [Nostoc sp. DedSLP01]MDZ8187508.1 hypothetical protein [Nostoc sp. ChiSLP02]